LGAGYATEALRIACDEIGLDEVVSFTAATERVTSVCEAFAIVVAPATSTSQDSR
jgi:hypothetical protein